MRINLTTFILITTLMQVSAGSFAQRLTLKEKNVSLVRVIDEIRKQTGYDVIIFTTKFKSNTAIDADFNNAPLDKVMERVVLGTGLSYSIKNKSVVIKEKEVPSFLDRVKAAFSAIEASGRVVDLQGAPLPGATVKVKKGKGTAVTDANGRFVITKVEDGAVLVVSYTGYISKEVVASTTMGNIALEQSLSKLDEVQVIAYGTTTRRLSTGNIGTVKTEDIEKQPVNNPLLALQGRVPGLFIEQATGFAGTGVKVRIQGTNSIKNGNDPFYVIDGVPFLSQLSPNPDQGSFVQGDSGIGGVNGNPLNFINPADIESIDILKDADATAIYGSRAANGAILITTKKGKAGATRLNVNFQTGFGEVPRKVKVLNTSQYLEMRHEALKNGGTAAPGPGDYDLNGAWDTVRNVNWQKKLLGGNALYSDFQASVSGGGNSTTFLIGTGYHREKNVFPGDFSDTKGSVHVNIDNTSLDNKFKTQFLGSYMADNNKLPTVDITLPAITMAPNAPEPYNSDGSLNWQPNGSGTTTYPWNPLAPFKNNYTNKTDVLTSNLSLAYSILKELEIKSSFGFSSLNSNQNILYPTTAQTPENLIYAKGLSAFLTTRTDSWIIEPQLKYKRNINIGKLELLMGATVQQRKDISQSILGMNYISDLLLSDLKSAPDVLVTGSNNTTYKYNALYGRLNYNWMDKYILNVTVRRDGSSNFGPESQFHNFGAVGAAWIFSENNFIKKNLAFLSQGKLRMSYGTTGSDQIGAYQFLDLYESIPMEVPYQGGLGLRSTGLNNPYLQWEETRKLQVGLDLGLLRDKFIFSINFNRNRSSNQLISLPLPLITGAENIAFNLPAVVQNTGWEISIVSDNIRSENIGWTSSMNLTIPRNKLVSFTGFELQSYSGFFLGQPLSAQYVYQFAGVNENTGFYQFLDSQAKITSQPSNPQDRTILINTDPRFYGGFQNSFRYRGFSMDILFQFVKQMGKDWSQTGTNQAAGRFRGTPNLPISLLDRWRNIGDKSIHQKFSSNFDAVSPTSYASQSDFIYKDASYIRLKNISVSWLFPDRWLKSIHMHSMSVFAQCQNLLTLTTYQGLDPETKGYGLPPLRTMTIGAKINL